MSKPDIFMPIYIGDYIRDTGHLSTAEHGAYMLLLMHYWSTGVALPGDEKRLARITKSTPQQWAESREVLLDFFELRDGRYFHKRVEHELQRAAKIYEDRSNAGAKGAANRWRKHSKANGSGIANESQSDRQNDANHNHTPTEDASSKQSSDRRARPAARGTAAAPVAATKPTLPDWAEPFPRWLSFFETLHPTEVLHFFIPAKLNGSETSLVVESGFLEEELPKRYGAKLAEHFGCFVHIRREDPKGKAG